MKDLIMTNHTDYILSFICESSAGYKRLDRIAQAAIKAIKNKNYDKASQLDDIRNKKHYSRKVKPAERTKRRLRWTLKNS